MFCSNCGKEIQENMSFCPYCGENVNQASHPVAEKVKVIFDPSEVVDAKQPIDSSKLFSGQGKTFGMVLMIVSIVFDLVGMFAIGFDAFIPITIGATVLFVIGFLLRIFCP